MPVIHSLVFESLASSETCPGLQSCVLGDTHSSFHRLTSLHESSDEVMNKDYNYVRESQVHGPVVGHVFRNVSHEHGAEKTYSRECNGDDPHNTESLGPNWSSCL